MEDEERAEIVKRTRQEFQVSWKGLEPDDLPESKIFSTWIKASELAIDKIENGHISFVQVRRISGIDNKDGKLR
jgi:hypothetical protein